MYGKREITSESLEGFRFVEINGKDYELKNLKTPNGKLFDYTKDPGKVIIDYPTARFFRPDPLQSGGVRKNQSLPFTFKGKTYTPNSGSCWKTTVQTDYKRTPGMTQLTNKNRLVVVGNGLYYRRYYDDFEYKELSNYNRIGTVVILSGWKQNYYEDLSNHLTKLHRRLIHHFGFAIGDIYNIGLKLKHKNKELEILPKDYDNDPKIQGLFDLPTIPIKTESGQQLGEVEFHIYKTVRSYSDSHKEPFLIVNGRPLGDTSISEMPRLDQYKEIWQSNTITGYVVCNAVEPNQMRIGLANNDALIPFLHVMTAASITLKGLNTIWKNELSSAIDKSMMNEVVDIVTRFLSKKGIKFNFKNPLQKGIQKDSKKQGEEITDERVSNESGGPNQGLIDDAYGEEDVLLGYRKTKTTKKSGDWDDDTIIVPHGGRKKDGNEIITVKVKRSLVSKGGRRIRKSYSGPDLDFNTDEDCGDELSYFESDPPTVMIQSEHEAWKNLAKKSRDQTNSEKYEKEKMNYLLERYLWELMNNEAIQKDDELSDADRKNMFWTYYHDLIDTK